MDGKEAGRLAEKYAPAVYRLAYAHGGNAADAEDVMQDVFLRLLTKAPVFRDDDHAKAWLLRVAVNRARDLLRAARRQNVPLEMAENVSAPERPAGETLQAVLALPSKLRLAVHLFYYEELPVKEIAAALGISQGAVKARLSRARKQLRASLTEGGGERVSG